MARLRNDGQRAFAALILIPFILTSCSGYLAGFRDQTDPDAIIGELDMSSDTEQITILVRLPDGYLAAEGFVQRAEFETDAGVLAATRNDLADAFVLDLGTAERAAIAAGETGMLRLTLGFCNVNTKDVCHIDIASLSLRATGPGERRVGLLYSPPLPG